MLGGSKSDAGEAGVQDVRALVVAKRIAGTIAKRAPLGVRATLESGRTTLAEGPEAATAKLLEQARALMDSDDAAEGMRSFVERREASFTGK